MSDHHRLMIRFSLEHLRFLEDQIYQLGEEISKKIREAGYELGVLLPRKMVICATSSGGLPLNLATRPSWPSPMTCWYSPILYCSGAPLTKRSAVPQ